MTSSPVCSPRALRALLGACICLLALLWTAPHALAAEGVETSEFRLEYSDGNWQTDANFDFELPGTLEDAINKGIPLFFVIDFEATRSRWYWFDEKTITASLAYRVSFQPLTRQYRVSSGGGLQQRFTTLKDALSLIRRIRGWQIAERGVFKHGETYQVGIRMRLDVSQLPKPFQVNAVNSRDWNLSSDWRRMPVLIQDR